jgi:TetR/AcrR family transcriptional regulator, cholesterol catabolism regulator
MPRAGGGEPGRNGGPTPAAGVNGATAREGRRTRERIVRSAARLFADRGYFATSLEDIAQDVGIRKASLYWHVSSKAHLLGEILSGCIEPAYQALLAIQASPLPPTEKLRQAISAHVLEITDDVEAVRIFLREGSALPAEQTQQFMARRRAYARLFGLILEEGQASGEFQADDLHHAALALLGMANWIAFWYRPDGPSSPEAIAASFAELAVRSVESRLA